MKHNLLHLFCIVILLSSCKQKNPETTSMLVGSQGNREIVKILDLIDSTGTRYIYIYNNYTVKDEIAYHKKIQGSLSTEDSLYRRLKKHIERSEIIAGGLKDLTQFSGIQIGEMGSDVIIYAKPPNPCPDLLDTTKSSSSCLYLSKVLSYYTEDAEDSLTVKVDGNSIKIKDASYDSLTRIRTFELSEPIQGAKGAESELNFEVTNMGKQKEIKYKEKLL